MHLSTSAVASWKSGRTPFDSTIRRICDYFNLPHNFFDRNDSAENDRWINVVGDIAAGIPIEQIQDIIDREQLSPTTDMTYEYIGLRIRGDSMLPRICDGDYVIIRIQDDCESGDIVAVSIGNENATCKKLIKSENGIALVSLNPAYEPLYYSKSDVERLPIRLIGRVVELRAKFK